MNTYKKSLITLGCATIMFLTNSVNASLETELAAIKGAMKTLSDKIVAMRGLGIEKERHLNFVMLNEANFQIPDLRDDETEIGRYPELCRALETMEKACSVLGLAIEAEGVNPIFVKKAALINSKAKSHIIKLLMSEEFTDKDFLSHLIKMSLAIDIAASKIHGTEVAPLLHGRA